MNCCGQYFGCATWGNRFKWRMFVVGTVLGLMHFIASIVCQTNLQALFDGAKLPACLPNANSGITSGNCAVP
jgi:hypothetical protein